MSKRADAPKFENEAALVTAFCTWVDRENENRNRGDDRKWTAYHETAGWDLLLANNRTGAQIGIEAKLSLNPKVLIQALPDHNWWSPRGPDFRAVLVPAPDLQLCVSGIAKHLGITVITARPQTSYRNEHAGWNFGPELPDESDSYGMREWPHWLPAERCNLPEYIPDVTGGHSAPIALTQWKIKAIRLMILLDRRGYVTRKDMNALQISPTRWTDGYHGFLARDADKGGFVRCDRTPDLRAQHPTNYAQIEADFDKWGAEMLKAGTAAANLFGGAAA